MAMPRGTGDGITAGWALVARAQAIAHVAPTRDRAEAVVLAVARGTVLGRLAAWPLVVCVDAVADGQARLHGAFTAVVAVAGRAGLGHLALVALVALGTAAVWAAVGSGVAGAPVMAEPGWTHLQLALRAPVLQLAIAHRTPLLHATRAVARAITRGANRRLALIPGEGGERAITEGLSG